MAAVEEGGSPVLPSDQPPCPVPTRPAIVYRDCLSRGTVHRAEPFDVVQDSDDLHAALKASDDKAITAIISTRTNDQRQAIAAAYRQKYGVNLLDDLSNTFSAQYRKAIQGLMEEPFLFLAKHVYETLTSSSLTHKDVALLEILYPLEPQEIDAISQAYKGEYKQDLRDEIEKQMTGVFRDVLTRLVTGKRCIERKVNVSQRNQDLEYLRNNTQECLQSADDDVIRIFGNSSLPQLSSIFLNFDKAGGCTLQEFIRNSAMDGHAKQGFSVMVKSVYNRTGFFADQLHLAIKDSGTAHEDRLMRILISRSEIDLENITDFFQSAYSHTLSDFVYDDTSEDYRNLLLRLVGM